MFFSSILSSRIAFLPEICITHRLQAVYFHPMQYIYVFSLLLLTSYVNNRKRLKAPGLRGLCCLFDGLRVSVRHGWYIFEWHFISAISLILIWFPSFIGMHVHQCMCACVVAAIKWKRSPYQTICFCQGGRPSADLGLRTGLRSFMS